MSVRLQQKLRSAARNLAAYCQHTLTRLGYAYVNRTDDTEWRVRFHVDHARVDQLSSGEPAIELPVDVHRLPRKVTTQQLAGAGVLHELSTALGGLPVEVKNTSGLSYVIGLEPMHSTLNPDQLPKRVPLDLSERPRGPYMVPWGVGADGPHWDSLLKTLNTLVAGEPGGGKSMLINTWIAALTQAYTPQELRLTLVDPKRVELAGWRHLPHLAGSIAMQAEEAEAEIDALLRDIDHRARLMQSVGARNLAGYNKMASAPGAQSLPLHLVVIDELTDLTLAAGGPKSSLFKKLVRCASTGRALGILFLVATQSPRADIINANFKATMNTRLAFRTASRTDSRVILDRPEAASIHKQDRGRFVTVIDGELAMLQGFYLDDEALRAIQQAHAPEDQAAGTLLTDAERQLVIHAVEALGGAFKIHALAEDLADWSEWKVRKLAQAWERQGWLTPPADAVSPRYVTPELARLAGVTPDVPPPT